MKKKSNIYDKLTSEVDNLDEGIKSAFENINKVTELYDLKIVYGQKISKIENRCEKIRDLEQRACLRNRINIVLDSVDFWLEAREKALLEEQKQQQDAVKDQYRIKRNGEPVVSQPQSKDPVLLSTPVDIDFEGIKQTIKALDAKCDAKKRPVELLNEAENLVLQLTKEFWDLKRKLINAKREVAVLQDKLEASGERIPLREENIKTEIDVMKEDFEKCFEGKRF
jgi:hypothetical protein